MRIYRTILLAVLAAGCGRPSAPPTGGTGPTSTTNAMSVTPPAAAVSAQSVTSGSEPAPRTVPFTVFARFGTPEDPSVALVDKKTKRGSKLKRGESHSGYQLASVDFEKDEAVFVFGGEEVRVPITRSVAAVPGTAPSEAEARSLPVPDLAAERVEKFDQTPSERASGIDPNDPTTWPPGYRGPGIERALAGVAPMGPETPAVRTNGSDYAATPSETVRGIDPNNSATWPADYKGPGIERAMQANPGAAQPQGPTLQAQPEGVLQPAQGMGSGIEQALREQQGLGQ